MKLWDKGESLSALAETFTVGDDPQLDQKLAYFDSLGSIAHAKGIYSIGLLSLEEFSLLQKGLLSIGHKALTNQFPISPNQEDMHTAIENALTTELGEVGKKLHMARSRNDQVLVALRLFAKHQLLDVGNLLVSTIDKLIAFADDHQQIPIPGRTHMQKAMPSTLGLWGGSFAESLLDDFELLKGAYALNNQSPLGSAASYGVPLPLDRLQTAKALGFDKVQNNVLYAGSSRGKIEGIILHCLTHIMNGLSKLSADLIFFSLPEVGYLKLPQDYCFGSSLMPQKQNPDILELIRAKAASVSSFLTLVLEISRPLTSGYHRDFQETKGPLIKGFEITSLSLNIIGEMLPKIRVASDHCLAGFSTDIFATDAALELATKGIPFRDAYQQVGKALEKVTTIDPLESALRKKHLGAPGNLGLKLAKDKSIAAKDWLEQETMKWETMVANLSQEEMLP